MGKAIFILIGISLGLVGTVLIYDARVITKKVFGFGDQNEASMGLKILGFILAIAGAILAIKMGL